VFIEDTHFRSETLTLEPGDTLYFYSDGVTEAIAEDESFFGEERLDALLQNISPEMPVADLNQAIITAVDQFAGAHEQADDITMLTLRFMTADKGVSD
jgi:phosphoserine phosphatase RsbU/P